MLIRAPPGAVQSEEEGAGRVLTGGMMVEEVSQGAVTAANGSAWATAATFGEEILKVTIWSAVHSDLSILLTRM